MASHTTSFFYAFCTLCVISSISNLAAAEVECFVCPGDQLSNCAPSGKPTSFSESVDYILKNCTYGCGKLISWNPKQPTQPNYVGLRNTVRNLEYKYCATKQEWTGCYKSESAITTSIECVCIGHRCNGAGRPGTGPWALAAPLMFVAAAWALLAV